MGLPNSLLISITFISKHCTPGAFSLSWNISGAISLVSVDNIIAPSHQVSLAIMTVWELTFLSSKSDKSN